MDIGIIQKDFPLKVIYMNNASHAPMPINSIKAATDFILFLSEYGPDSNIVHSRIEELMIDTRKRIASMLNCNEQEIVFTQSTTEGINFVSKGLRWKQGDNIIIRDGMHEHPANYIPWIMLLDNGVEIRRLTIDENGSIDLEELRRMIDQNTRLIALSHVLFNTGLILPVEKISKIAKEYSVPLFIDAAQSVGSFDVDLSKIDCNFLSFPAYKWLCGPTGIGVFYCKKETQDLLQPLISGSGSTFLVNDEMLLKDTPARFEAGFRNYIGIASFNSSLKYIMNVGINNIRKRNIELANILREGLKDHVILYGPEREDERNSIVSFGIDDIDAVINKLEKENIVFAKRDIKGKNIIRASPHFFNDEHQITVALNLIRSIIKSL